MRIVLALVLVGAVAALAAVLEETPSSRADEECFTEFREGIDGHSGAVLATRDGRVWFSELPEDRLGTIDPSTGAVEEYDLPPMSAPRALAEGPDGEIWFSSLFDRIGRFDPDTESVRTYETGITPNSAPHSIVYAPDGNVYFTKDNEPQLGRLDPATGTIEGIATGLPEGGPLVGLTIDPGGESLWTSRQLNDVVARFDLASGSFDRFLDFPAGSGPHDVALLDGRLYAALQGSGEIGEQDADGGETTLYDLGLGAGGGPPAMPPLSVVELTVGPDGETIWATSFQANRVFRLDPGSGRVSEPCVFEPGGSATQIVAGPGERIWFANPIGGSVFRIDREE